MLSDAAIHQRLNNCTAFLALPKENNGSRLFTEVQSYWTGLIYGRVTVYDYQALTPQYMYVE